MGSATFNLTGHWQTFNVPTGVTSIVVALNGAGSGGQRGGRVTGRLAVKDTDTLWIVVGENGNSASGRSGGAAAFGAGAAGGDGYNANGGQSGGGYSGIRIGSTSGRIACVAGGAGGDSGDGGNGGAGGAATGQSGSRGSAGSGATGAATGGTQTQGGNGGTSSSGSQFNGHNASDTTLASAGAGGDTGGYDGPGGGGGGGGYHGGGGGQGGSDGWAPGGGGAGGSNYYGGLTSAASYQGQGSLSAGVVTLSWSDPAPSNSRPNNPSVIAPIGHTRLKAQSFDLQVKVSDPNGNTVRAMIQVFTALPYSSTTQESTFYTGYNVSGTTITREITLERPNTHYYLRVYAQDSKGSQSLGYYGVDYYSNYAPDPPVLTSPPNGAQRSALDSMVFDWTPVDQDEEAQGGAEIRYYRDPEATLIATRSISGSSHTYTENPTTFKSNHFYLWQVRTKDPHGLWGDWSDTFRFFISGNSTPPRPLLPRNGEAIVVDDDETFTWQFVDPDQGDSQMTADLRYRAVGEDDAAWITLLGDFTAPGSAHSWVIPAGTFAAEVLYEWQVRTYDALGAGISPSGWSDSQQFRSISRPGRDADIGTIGSNVYQGVLGCGHNYAVATAKGGSKLLGALTPYSLIKWNRIRDDISKCNLTLNITSNAKTCELAATLRTWIHEVKVFRDDGSVWEGPITRIAYHSDRVEIEAWDVMGWVYRRIMKQGYNDSYPHNLSVVDRAARIIINALAPDDPNVLRFLTQVRFPDDAKQSRVRDDWASTAWEEVDDLAAKAGMDYTVVGRRIILWDTHRSIGRLPEMRDNAFSDPPVVTEYGMNLATEYGITNNAGLYASATRDSSIYGPVEMLSAAYGESEGGTEVTLTAAAKQALLQSMGEQAERGISDRYPAPLIVRVPDNATLSPDVPVSIDHLVPGVWIPVQAMNTCRTVSQWQKLDQVTVTETPEDGEKIQVVMSPAPNGGQDPDADAAAAAEDA